MECIYLENLSDNNKHYTIIDNEVKHLKALHINSNDEIMITNGKGLSAIATINRPTKNEFYANVKEFLYNYGENKYKLILAIGILDNKDRFEFAIEKATELGVSEIIPLITQFGEQTEINKERLKAKTIATIKQCKRSQLPTIYSPTSIFKLLEHLSQMDLISKLNIILADENGKNIVEVKNKLNNEFDTYIFVGSEGGFSNKELEAFPKQTIRIKLGNRRLRAETATIVTTGIIANLLQ